MQRRKFLQKQESQAPTSKEIFEENQPKEEEKEAKNQKKEMFVVLKGFY